MLVEPQKRLAKQLATNSELLQKTGFKPGKGLKYNRSQLYTGIEGSGIADNEAKKYANISIAPGAQGVQILAHAKRVT